MVFPSMEDSGDGANVDSRSDLIRGQRRGVQRLRQRAAPHVGGDDGVRSAALLMRCFEFGSITFGLRAVKVELWRRIKYRSGKDDFGIYLKGDQI
eukprot:6192814-Pleurochrysis_carterae.AAC.3